MAEKTVLLNAFEKTKNFNRIATKQEFDIDLVSGRYVVDAKSVVGIYSLDLSKPVKMVCHTDNADTFLDAIKDCLV